MRSDKNNNDAIHRLDKLGSNQVLAFKLFSSKARHLFSNQEVKSSSFTLRILTNSLCRYQESLCPVEHMHSSDEKSITDEIW